MLFFCIENYCSPMVEIGIKKLGHHDIMTCTYYNKETI